MGRGFAWLDTGTHDSLIEAATFIATLQKRQGLVVACPEEIAYRQQWIDGEQLSALAKPLAKNAYGKYLQNILTDPSRMAIQVTATALPKSRSSSRRCSAMRVAFFYESFNA
jgi:hypothetical protein